MNKKHERPPNGPGNNGLRGGPKNYSSKTAVGTWLEEWGGPQYYQRGFSSDDFTTECQHQQTGATLSPPKLYGAELQNIDKVRSPIKNSDVFQPPSGPGPDTWVTTTRDMGIQLALVIKYITLLYM